MTSSDQFVGLWYITDRNNESASHTVCWWRFRL